MLMHVSSTEAYYMFYVNKWTPPFRPALFCMHLGVIDHPLKMCTTWVNPRHMAGGAVNAAGDNVDFFCYELSES